MKFYDLMSDFQRQLREVEFEMHEKLKIANYWQEYAGREEATKKKIESERETLLQVFVYLVLIRQLH